MKPPTPLGCKHAHLAATLFTATELAGTEAHLKLLLLRSCFADLNQQGLLALRRPNAADDITACCMVYVL